MASNLFQQMGNGQKNNGGMESAFSQFMQQMRGQNPGAIIQQMVQSGQLSQAQLNAVQQRAQQMGGIFGAMKSRFGF